MFGFELLAAELLSFANGSDKWTKSSDWAEQRTDAVIGFLELLFGKFLKSAVVIVQQHASLGLSSWDRCGQSRASILSNCCFAQAPASSPRSAYPRYFYTFLCLFEQLREN